MSFDSKTRHGPGELADSVGSVARATLGLVRRMAIKVTSRALWQVIGHRLIDGSRETRDAEVFYGIGFWSRPKSSEKAEAIVAFVGGDAGNPVVVASRNEDARRYVQSLIGTIAEGDTVIHGSIGTPIVWLKNDGTAEIRTAGGTAVPLATLADVQALRNYVNNQFCNVGGHTHVVSGAATTTITTVASAGGTPPTPAAPPAPQGTDVLKAE